MDDSPRMVTGPICAELHVRAAAQFERERAADLDDPHLVGVGLAEQRHRAHRLGLLESVVKLCTS